MQIGDDLKLDKTNKIHAAIYTALGILIVFLAIMWYRCYSKSKETEIALANSYDRAFFELTDYVSDIDALLSKAQLAASPAQMASISNEIFMQAAEAKSRFGDLPYQDVNLENTAKFLAQVGDYTYVLSQNMINGEEISQEEYDNLSALNSYAAELSQRLSAIQSDIYSGEIRLSSSGEANTVYASDSILTDLENVEKSFDGYPSLIYDGPFSEHIESIESYMLKNAPEITQDEALMKANDFLGARGDGLAYEAETSGTAVDCYIFSKNDDNGSMTVSVTKRGGYILYFLQNREIGTPNHDINSATELAAQFLSSNGFSDFTDSYYEVQNNIATINFAYVQDGVKCYSDLIKIRVALDNGDIIGAECKGYIMNHRERDLSKVSLTEEEARNHVSTHLDVTAVSKAVIPKDSLQEVLCYEFKGTYMDKNFIVYVNADNGREEEIMLLIESETGVLTI